MSSDLVTQSLLLQARNPPRSLASRLAEQMMQQSARPQPGFGAVGVLANAAPPIVSALMALRGEAQDREREQRVFDQLRAHEAEQNAAVSQWGAGLAGLLRGNQPPAAPPASTPTPMPQGAPRAPGGDWLNTLEQQESGGNPTARNPRSSATGAFQFIDGTWREFARQNPDLFQGMTPDQVMAARNDPALSRRAAEWYATTNGNALRAAGLEPTPANLALSHFFGAGGAQAVLRGDPNAPVVSTVPNGDRVLAANPQLRGMTNAQIIEQHNRRFGGGDGMPSAPPPAQQPPGAPGISGASLLAFLTDGLQNPNPRVRERAQAMMPLAQALLAREDRLTDRAEDRTFRDRQLLLQERSAGQEIFGAPVTEQGPDGRPIVVRYGNRGTRQIVPNATPEAPRAGLNPIQAYDENGAPTVLLPRNDGTLARPALPEGVTLTPRTREINTGTEMVTVDQGGRVVARRPIDIVGRETAEAVGQRQGAEVAGASGAVRQAEQSIGLIDAVIDHPALRTATGALSFTGAIPGTPQFDFAQRVAQLQGRAFLDAFESLRGGGAITQIEGEKATQAIARLNRGASASDFRQALNELREVLDAARQRAAARVPQAPQAQIGTSGQGADPPPAPAQRQRLRFNPQTGDFE